MFNKTIINLFFRNIFQLSIKNNYVFKTIQETSFSSDTKLYISKGIYNTYNYVKNKLFWKKLFSKIENSIKSNWASNNQFYKNKQNILL